MTSEHKDEAQDWEGVKSGEHVADEDYITDETRRACYRRDGYKCCHCGEEDLDALTLHHVVYRSQSGGHEAANLVTLCWRCHRKVHDKVLRVAMIGGKWFFSDKTHWRNRQHARR